MNRMKKTWRWFQQYGVKLLFLKLFDKYKEKPLDYTQWLKCHTTDRIELLRQTNESLEENIKISIVVPIYCTPEKYLCEMIESVQNQSYPHWELCLADGSTDEYAYKVICGYATKDSRIKVKRLKKNWGIADNTNEAISMCTGDYIGLLDHDDTLSLDALYEVVKAIKNNNEPDVIYTDEDKMSMNGMEYYEPHFKSGFNKELLRSNNYICHFFIVKKEVINRIGGFRNEFEGAQDYDFILRCTEVAKKIVHIAKPLYHWRSHDNSTAENPESKLFAYESGKRAIEEQLKRAGEKGVVLYTNNWGFYHVKYQIVSQDKVTIIVFGCDKQPVRIVKKCLASIRKTSGYNNYEIFTVNNLKDLKNVKIGGRYVVLINSAINLITYGWLSELLGTCQRSQVGALGIKLYNKCETIRHAGIILGMKGYAFEGFPRVRSGYFHRDEMMQNMSAVTIDFMMLPRELFSTMVREELSLFNNEIALCENIRRSGKEIILNPSIEAYIEGESSKVEYQIKETDIYYNENFELSAPGYTIK